ncbi:MAG: hypothetical protein ACRDXE_02835, partial [Acidimicrobiales bacterium]
MNIKQKLAVGATGLIGAGIGSLGPGIAHAQTPAPAPSAPAISAPSAPASSTAGGNVQQGDQKAPDSTPGADPAETGSGTAADGPGGHQDPPGANVQSGDQSGPDTPGAN